MTQDKTIETIPEEFNEVVGDYIISKDLYEHMNYEFLKSSRFWSLVVGAVMIYLESKGIVGLDEMILVDTILGGHIIIRSLDRNTGDAVKKGV